MSVRRPRDLGTSGLFGSLPGPDRLGRSGVQRHLVRVSDFGLEPDGPGGRVDHVDHLGQQTGRVLVAGLVRERYRPAQRGGRGILVACLAGFEPVLDGLGELCLAGVVGDIGVDPRGQRLSRLVADFRPHAG